MLFESITKTYRLFRPKTPPPQHPAALTEMNEWAAYLLLNSYIYIYYSTSTHDSSRRTCRCSCTCRHLLCVGSPLCTVPTVPGKSKILNFGIDLVPKYWFSLHPYWWHYRKCQEIIKKTRFHPLGNMSVLNFMVIHPIVVEIVHSGPKW